MHEYNSQYDECIVHVYNFVIKPFLLLNSFNAKILNQLIIVTVHSQL